MFAASTAIFFLFGTAAGQIPLPVIPGTGSSEGPADVPTETPVPEWIQTQEAIQMMQTEIVQTQDAISVMQTQAVWDITLEAVNAEQTRVAQTQAAIISTQTQSAAPTATPTPTQRPTATPRSINTLKPTAVSIKIGVSSKTPAPTKTPIEKSIKVGDKIIIGDNEWRVLSIEDGKALLLSEYGVKSGKYHETLEYVVWASCDLRKWLNGDFYRYSFSDDEKKYIVETTNKTPNNPYYGTWGGQDTKDKVFILSEPEIEKYMPDYQSRMCNPQGYVDYGADSWWTRTPGHDSQYVISVKNRGGYFDTGYGVTLKHIIRPAIWIDIQSYLND